jgi:phytanoyl-CoA hydroxylase
VAGLLDEALDTHLLTVWIAISDAREEQGCLVVIPGSHRSNHGTLTTHCPEGVGSPSNFIAQQRLAPAPRILLPVKRVGVVLMHRLTQQTSLENHSKQLRFAFDLRYQPIGQPTGRPAFPGFVARSKRNPQTVLRNVEARQQKWRKSLQALRSGTDNGPIYETTR